MITVSIVLIFISSQAFRWVSIICQLRWVSALVRPRSLKLIEPFDLCDKLLLVKKIVSILLRSGEGSTYSVGSSLVVLMTTRRMMAISIIPILVKNPARVLRSSIQARKRHRIPTRLRVKEVKPSRNSRNATVVIMSFFVNMAQN